MMKWATVTIVAFHSTNEFVTTRW